MKVLVNICSDNASHGVKHVLCDVQDIYHDYESDCLVILTGTKKILVDVMYATSVKMMETALTSDYLDLSLFNAKVAE